MTRTLATLTPRVESLCAALTAHRTNDEREVQDRLAMLELVHHGEDAFSRSHFQPGHFTASAFVLSPDRHSLLLIYSTKFNRWLQPGGHIDPADESVAEAAVREVLEETGVEVQSLRSKVQGRGSETLDLRPWTLDLFDLDIHPIPANPSKGEPAHHHFDARFLFVAPTFDHAPGSDAHETRWVPLEEVTEELTDASVMRAVRKIHKSREA